MTEDFGDMGIMLWIVLIGIAFIDAVWCGMCSKRLAETGKLGNPSDYFWLGFLLGPIGLAATFIKYTRITSEKTSFTTKK